MKQLPLWWTEEMERLHELEELRHELIAHIVIEKMKKEENKK